jgi:hypothetical protein
LRALAQAVAAPLLVTAAAVVVSRFQPEPTLVDRALPLLAALLWAVAAGSARGLRRDLVFLAVPLLLTAALIPDERTRLITIGLLYAGAIVCHLGTDSPLFRSREMIAAAAIAVPVRLSWLGWTDLAVQIVFVAGSVVFWRELRRLETHRILTAGVVLLLALSIPAEPARLAIVPWVAAGAARLTLRVTAAVGVATLVAAAVAGNWLILTVTLVLLSAIVAGHFTSLEPAQKPAFIPAFGAVGTSLEKLVPVVPFFPAIFTRGSGGLLLAPLFTAAVLAAVLRPPLAIPILAFGMLPILPRIGETLPRTVVLPTLVFLFAGLLWFPWSGAAVARPPAPLPSLLLLAVAMIALLAPVVRAWSGVVAAALVIALALSPFSPEVEQRGERMRIDQSLGAGESASIRAPENDGRLRIRIGLANMADAKGGDTVATVSVIDRSGRAWSRTVDTGEIADWGAFRPEQLWGSWNSLPEAPGEIDGVGLRAWIRGSGAVPVTTPEAIEWLLITASGELAGSAQVVVEEILVE